MKSFCLSKHHHDSTSEADDCNRLLADLQCGRILSYKVWPSIVLHIDGKTWKRWKVDFQFVDRDGTDCLFESKGWNRSDDNCRLKLSAYLTEYPDRPIYVGTFNYTNRRRATLSADLKVLRSGIKSRTAKRAEYKTYDRRLGKYVTVKLKRRSA